MTGLPSGRGRKGGVPHRKKAVKGATPELSTPRPVFLQQPVSSAQISQSTQSFPVSTSPISVSSNISASQQVSVSQSVTPLRSSTLGQLLSNAVLARQSSPSMFTAPQPNTNPFYVKFIQGNIRMCQGCKSSLRSSDSSISSPSF